MLHNTKINVILHYSINIKGKKALIINNLYDDIIIYFLILKCVDVLKQSRSKKEIILRIIYFNLHDLLGKELQR